MPPMGEANHLVGPNLTSTLPRDLWSRLGSAPHRLLALDYDGTLAPFHKNPAEAVPLPGNKALLRDVAALPHHTVAIVSGRPVEEIIRLLGRLHAVYIGCHGFERLAHAGEIWVKKPSSIQRSGLERAAELARDLGYADRLEHKIASVALHTRPMDASEAAGAETMCFERWSAVASEHDLECRRFNGGVEIRSLGTHKGDALLELIGGVPPGTFVVYVGDDDTDEDAFRVARDYGVGIKVGPAPEGTAAELFLEDCAAVKAFLQTWHHRFTAHPHRR